MTDLASPESTCDTLRLDRSTPRAGTLVDGRYLVERVLGRGGMGMVVAARPLDGGEPVAIKFLLPGCAGEERILVRFEREARATERLRSVHVRRVHGAGTTEAGARYIVMEYLDGEDLRALVDREGPLDPRRAAEYVVQACLGLADAHALGIVHRDLKPGNLFLARQPDGPSVVKVVDFGVAKFESPNAAGDHRDPSTSGQVLGSRNYMAPEQILAPRSVDALADVWALGAILYFLLTGKTPFGADTPEETTLALLCEPPHPLSEARPDLPPRLVEVVERCLQKERTARYPNVVELMRALSPLTRSRAGSEPPRNLRPYLARTLDLGRPLIPAPPPMPRITVKLEPRAPEPRPRPLPPPRRSLFDRWLPAISVVGGLLAGGLLAVLVTTVRPRAVPAAAPEITRAPEVAPLATAEPTQRPGTSAATPPEPAAPPPLDVTAPPEPVPSAAPAARGRGPRPPAPALVVSAPAPASAAPATAADAPAAVPPPRAQARIFDVW